MLGARTRELSAGLTAILEEAQVPRELLFAGRAGLLICRAGIFKWRRPNFFPAALEHLADEDWEELQARMTTPEDPLFGERVGERFEHLRKTILVWQEQHRHAGG